MIKTPIVLCCPHPHACQLRTFMIPKVCPSERHFNKVTTVGIKRAAVCFKSSFGPKLGTSTSPMVRGWPCCHGYSTLISMQTPSRCAGKTHCWPGLTLCQRLPPHTETEFGLCKHKHIMNPMLNKHIFTYQHMHIHSDGIRMHIWTYTLPRAGQKSAVLHVRPDAFSNSSTHKCIIRLF